MFGHVWQLVVSFCADLWSPSPLLDNVRNIATIVGSVFIPLAIYRVAQSRERKRASLGLLRLFTTDTAVTDRLVRLYHYRVREQAEADGLPAPPNPFASDAELVIDSTLILNLCDTVSIEIDRGMIHRRLIYRSLGPTLVGVRDVVMRRLETRFNMRVADGFPDFLRMVSDIERFQQRQRQPFLNRIPRIGGDASC